MASRNRVLLEVMRREMWPTMAGGQLAACSSRLGSWNKRVLLTLSTTHVVGNFLPHAVEKLGKDWLMVICCTSKHYC